MKSSIKNQIMENIEVKQCIYNSPYCINIIQRITGEIIKAYKKGNSLLLCGNGGSASDAQHIACEMVSKLKIKRRAYSAISLSSNISIITAIGNDFEFDAVYERQIEALGSKGDILLSISTSGNSNNIYRAILKANSMGLMTISLLGQTGGKCNNISDISFVVPSMEVTRIQECHIMLGHIICDLVEKNLA